MGLWRSHVKGSLVMIKNIDFGTEESWVQVPVLLVFVHVFLNNLFNFHEHWFPLMRIISVPKSLNFSEINMRKYMKVGCIVPSI